MTQKLLLILTSKYHPKTFDLILMNLLMQEDYACVSTVVAMVGNAEYPYDRAQMVSATETKPLPDIYYITSSDLVGGTMQFFNGKERRWDISSSCLF